MKRNGQGNKEEAENNAGGKPGDNGATPPADLDAESDNEFTEEELEELFRQAEEEERQTPFFQNPRFRKMLAGAAALMLLAQVLAFFPQFFSLAAIKFLRVSAELSQSEDIQRYKQSVVVIRSGDAKGTGFIVSEDGLVVTNRHVVDPSQAPMVHLPNGKPFTAEVVSIDEKVDLALLKIKAEGLPALRLAPAYHYEAGERIYIIGNPLFFNGIANEGEIWGLSRGQDPAMIVLHAPVYKGNSGSPVINQAGEVIGIVFAVSTMEFDGKKQ